MLSRSEALFDANVERLQTRKPFFNLRVAPWSPHYMDQPALVDVGCFPAQDVHQERLKGPVPEEWGQFSAQGPRRGLRLAEGVGVEQVRVALGDQRPPRVLEVLQKKAKILRVSGSPGGPLVPRDELQKRQSLKGGHPKHGPSIAAAFTNRSLAKAHRKGCLPGRFEPKNCQLGTALRREARLTSLLLGLHRTGQNPGASPLGSASAASPVLSRSRAPRQAPCEDPRRPASSGRPRRRLRHRS